jgi:Putative RNA methylase family UPF0020
VAVHCSSSVWNPPSQRWPQFASFFFRRQPRPPPPGHPGEPSLQLFVTMWKDEVQIFRDVSGESLHRRGYRGVIHKFALNEAAAAGVLHLAGWPEIAEAGGKLVDPMCGSGTILVEAALMAHRVAPGLFRDKWAHTSWPDFDKRAWREALDAARGSVRREWAGVIAGNDVDEVWCARSRSCAVCLTSWHVLAVCVPAASSAVSTLQHVTPCGAVTCDETPLTERWDVCRVAWCWPSSALTQPR